MCHQYPQDTHLVGLLVRQADEHGQDEDVEGVDIVATQAHKERRRAHTEHCTMVQIEGSCDHKYQKMGDFSFDPFP